MTNQRNWRKWLQPIGVPAAVFAVIALILAIVTRQVVILQDEVRHAQDVKDQLSAVTVALAEDETAVRGYILSGDKALRGIDVRVVVPDIKLVDWAMDAKFSGLLENGVRIYKGEKPFDHSKLMIVDDTWVLVGSSNWDQRSLRLNFEANLECYDAGLAAVLEDHFQKMMAQGKSVSLKGLQDLPWQTKLRNNIARLFIPYL